MMPGLIPLIHSKSSVSAKLAIQLFLESKQSKVEKGI
jgi:hypothetical protein